MRLNIQTKFQTNFYRITLATTAIWIMTGCGSTTARDSTAGISSTTSSASSSNISPGNISNLQDAKITRIAINGPQSSIVNGRSQTITVQTSRTLKVKVTAVGAPRLTLEGYTGWVFPYGCLRLQVKVNGQFKYTDILRVDGVASGNTAACAGAPSHQVLDFTNDVTGNGTTSVVVSDPEYDNCRDNWPLHYGCQMSPIFKDHIVAADIQIQTDNLYMSP